MSRIKQLLAVAVVAAVPLLAAPVSAVEDCTVSNTGPGSTNECTNVSNYRCVVTENNQVTIYNQSNQDSISGTGTVTNNTQGGGAFSGTVTNTNGTQFNVTIDNGGCTVTTVVAPVPPVVTPPKPEVVKPPVEQKPTVLANTSGDMTATIVATLLAVSVIASAILYAVSVARRQSRQ